MTYEEKQKEFMTASERYFIAGDITLVDYKRITQALVDTKPSHLEELAHKLLEKAKQKIMIGENQNDIQ